MSNVTKFFSALALAAALAPAAAHARSDRAPAQNQAQQQYLAGNFASGPSAAFGRGRAAASGPVAGQLFIVTATQYAAAASIAPEEN